MSHYRIFVQIILFAIITGDLHLNAQSLGPKKENEGESVTQKYKLKMLNPGIDLLSGDQILKKWQQVNDIPSYSVSSRNSSPWELFGPSGHKSSEGYDFYCSGRVRDVEVINDNHMRVVAASGGLWDVITEDDGQVSYKNLTATDVLSPWGGTVATDPFNENIILFGTGEPGIRGGTGLWRSENKGISWRHIPLNGGVGMGAFDEMEFTNQPGKVWTSGSDGVFFSTDSGNTWSQKWGGNCQGMVIFPDNPDIVLVGDLFRGIFKTTNGGVTWEKKTNGLPNSNFARVELSNCKTQPNVIYALFTTNEGFTEGIYKSVDSGESWQRCTVIDSNGKTDVDYHWGLGGYCSFISVSPTNPNHVISGGGWYIFSTDGQDFYGSEVGQHADFHTGGWSADGSMAYYGNDGGIYRTVFDQQWKWDHTINRIPITQFVTVAVAPTNNEAMIGGTQDNGLVYYVPQIKKWVYFLGDGGGVAYHPQNDETIFATLGLFGGELSFRNMTKKGPSTLGWHDPDFGLDPSGQWWRLVRADRNDPPIIYTQTDNKMYYSTNEGNSWNKFFTNDISINSFASMRISHGEFPSIYASGDGPDSSSCLMLDATVWEWTNISDGLPKATKANEYTVPHVYVSENTAYPDRVYALMRGYGGHIAGKVLFKSDAKGADWVNISGNLPDVPYTVMMEHPLDDQILVVGTDGFGMFITEDGGKNWQKWDDDLPKGTFITDFGFQKFSQDSVYIVASTYGHSIWRRLLPVGKLNVTPEVPGKFVNKIKSVLFQNEVFQITFTEELSDGYTIKVCNMEGRCVLQSDIQSGIQNVQLSTQQLPAGMYVVSLHNSGKVKGTMKSVKTN